MKQIKENIEAAHKTLSALCKAPKSFTMTIPARGDDTDMILGRALNHASEMVSTLQEIDSVLYSDKHSAEHKIAIIKDLICKAEDKFKTENENG